MIFPSISEYLRMYAEKTTSYLWLESVFSLIGLTVFLGSFQKCEMRHMSGGGVALVCTSHTGLLQRVQRGTTT